jgi:type IV pili sensor histidine kinase/response regulator
MAAWEKAVGKARSRFRHRDLSGRRSITLVKLETSITVKRFVLVAHLEITSLEDRTMLDATQLDAITQKSRACFLEEDAPQYQTQLEEELAQLENEENWQSAVASLKTTTHAIKGGAGIAQIPELNGLGRALEDLLQALQEQRVNDLEIAYQLVSEGSKELKSLLDTAIKGETLSGEVAAEWESAIAEFLESLPEKEETEAEWEEEGTPFFLIQNALEVDLEECMGRVEPFLQQPRNQLIPALRTFCDECTLFGQALGIDWLQEDIKPLKTALDENQSDLSTQAQTTLQTLREHREQYLSQQTASDTSAEFSPESESLSSTAIHSGLDLKQLLTGLDGVSQSFQELAINYERLNLISSKLQQVQAKHKETKSIQADLQDTLGELNTVLHRLRTKVNDSRLIPFGSYAHNFVDSLKKRLKQYYHQSTEWVIEGEDTLVDQVILEQLQTPLIHLFQNAFEHSIESKEERLGIDKSEVATVTFKAQRQENYMILEISDDGRGINLESLFDQAKEQGLTAAKQPKQLTRDQILEFAFVPNFFTLDSLVEERMVSLEEVRAEIERLNGTVTLNSTVGKSTKFILTFPLSINLFPLLLCRAQQQLFALPASKILAEISLSEMSSEEKTLSWENQTLPVYSLLELLPYSEPISPSGEEPIGLVVNVEETPIVVAVDSLKGERELVVQPLDRAIPRPSYVIGCTVLGTGQVVPVVDPDYWGELLSSLARKSKEVSSEETEAKNGESTIMVIDDSVTVRLTIEQILTDSGYHVIACRDGKEACQVLDETGEDIDMVFSDIEMPRLNGFGVLEAIRSHQRWHYLPVVMLTSPGKNNNEQKVYSMGANRFMSKQFRPEELIEVIQSYCNDKN